MAFKVGIVSSYNVLCGNATYSQVIVDGLLKDVEAVKIEVPIKVQKFRDPEVEKQILQKVSDCDAVNIQMELGLYGATPRAAAKLIKKIINRSKRVSLTMHRVEEQPLSFTRNLYNHIKTGGLHSALQEIIKYEISRRYKKIISCAYENDATFIVHTDREKKKILAYKPDASVIVHPIVWPDDYCVNKVDITELNAAYQGLFGADDRPIIGLFGFTSNYKNFLQVVRVVINEGKYRILIAGGTHPQSNEYGKHIKVKLNQRGSFFSEIQEISSIYMALNRKTKSAFISVHSPDDPNLVHLIKSVDVVAIPYTEVGQSASGIASLAIQFGKRVIFSDTHTSFLLSKFLNRKPVLFDTQSDLSLAKGLDRVFEEKESSISFDGYDFQSNIQTYLKSLKIRKAKCERMF